MIVAHIITEHFPPTKGGLEEWTRSLTDVFSTLGVCSIVYVCADEVSDDSLIEIKNLDTRVIYLKKERDFLEEPLKKNIETGQIKKERHRLNHNLIKNYILKTIESDSSKKHIILSNFLIGTGFLAASLSEFLKIPHIACVVGTDFSRGFFNPSERQTIEFVVHRAHIIVTKNDEQREGLKAYSTGSLFKTIHTSVHPLVFNYRWQARNQQKIRLFSDGGYSNKKGTQILLASFSRLFDEGLPIELTLYGSTMEGQEEYWQELVNSYKLRYSLSISFNGFLDQPSLWEKMLDHDIYCSATLGEGSSHARATALCLGMPVVSTLCGELKDIQSITTNVKLASPADPAHFTEMLREMCILSLEKKIAINNENLELIRTHFSAEMEKQQWREIFLNIHNI